MNVCLCVTNFKNDLLEAGSRTVVETALLLGDRTRCTLYTPGGITDTAWEQGRIEHVSYTVPRSFSSRIRVVRNIADLGHHMRARPRHFDIVHFYVGNLLELFLIRLLLPRLAAVKIATVWQPYMTFGESLRLPGLFKSQLTGIAHHYLFNSWLHLPLIRLGLGYFDHIVVQTMHQHEQLGFLHDRRIEVIQNPVRAPTARPPRPENDPRSVVYVGHATAVKGLDVLLAALARAKDRVHFQATLALSDFSNVNVDRLIRRHGLEERVSVKGRVDVFDEIARHDVLVLPHKTAVGTLCFPKVALEALAVGIPLIASNTAVLGELIEDGVTGFLVPPGDAAALERVLTSVLARPAEDLAAMRQRQREDFRRRFTLERYVERHVRMYTRLLRGAVCPGEAVQVL